jgi:RHS repeat-associated protein
MRAFGEVASLGMEDRLRFPGQLHSQETGLYYNYHRDYAPQLGRYVQSDPIGLWGGMNIYDYSLQNPLKFFDYNEENPIRYNVGFYVRQLDLRTT